MKGRFCLIGLMFVFQGALAVDLSLSVDQSPTNYEPGSSQSNAYEVTISKPNGSADVTDITVTIDFDKIPVATPGGIIDSMTWTCTGAGASSCDTAGGTTPNDSFTIDFDLSGDGNDVIIALTSATYSSSNLTDIVFEADITDSGQTGGGANNDGTGLNDSDDVTIDRDSVTDISISVTDSSTTYTPGNAASYTVTVSNAGPSDATGISISDGTPPSDLNITSWTCDVDPGSSCSASGGGTNVLLSLDLDANDQAVITVNGNYDSDATADPLDYTVTAIITDGDASDPDGASESDTDSNDLSPVSNLAISVDTDDPSTTEYTPGTSETYEVVVTNNGPSDVSEVTVSHSAVTEFSNISWTCSADSGSSCGASSGSSAINTTVDLQSGDSVTFTVDVDFDSAATTDPLVYQVQAANPASHGGTSPVNDSKSLDLVLESDLAVTVNDGAMAYVPGLGGTFTATVTNNGPSDVTGVTVDSSDLSEFATISWTCAVTDSNSDCPAGPVTSAINTTADLVAGDSAVFTVNVTYESSATTNPLVYWVEATNPSGVTGNSPATGTDNDDVLDRQVNLSLTKTGKVGTLVPQEPFTYTIVVENTGPSDLGGTTEDALTLSDMLDTTLAAHPSECNPDIDQPCWKYCPSDLGVPNSDISPDNCPGIADISTDIGYNLSIPMHLSAGSSSEVRVYSRVTVASGSDCDGSTSATREICNTASAQVTASNTSNMGTQNPLEDFVSNEIVVGTDLLVTKTDNLTTAAPGTEISYEVVVRNDGFTDAEGITVNDTLPLFPGDAAGFTPGTISWVCETTDDNACCVSQSTSCGLTSPVNGAPGDVLNTMIDLGGQSEVKFTITGTINDAATGTISNTATATLPGGIDEVDPSNNSATDDDTVLGAVSDVSVTKTLESATVNGSNPNVVDLQYEITVINHGPSNATSIGVSDALNDDNIEPTSRSWTCSVPVNGSCASAGPNVDMPINTTVDLAVGASATFVVDVSTIPFSQGSVVNIVSVTASGFDPVSINNTASVEYALSGSSQLRIDNDDALLVATPGLPTNYTIRVQNEGPDNVFGATVENLFPSQLTDVEWTCSAISPIPGDLTFFQSSDQTAIGSRMLISPDGSHMYIASPDLDGSAPYESRIYVFERDTTLGATYGQITFVEFITQGDAGIDGIESVQELQISDDGAYLYALSNEISDGAAAVATFNRNNNRLSPDYGRITFLNATTNEMPVAAVDMAISPDQKHLYVTGDDEIIRYARDVGTGLLTHENTDSTIVAGYLGFSSDGSNLYVVDEVGDQIDAYDRETDDSAPEYGDLTKIGDVADADIDAVSDLLISDDDKSIYLAATGTNMVVVINRDLSTGMISFGTSYDDMALGFNATETLVGLQQLGISPDGEHLFVSNPVGSASLNGSLLVLGRNSQGLLNKDQQIAMVGMEGLIDVMVAPDGKQVLTTASDLVGKTVMAFDRRQPDPTFSFVEVEIDGQDSLDDSAGVVDGLLGASAVVVSADGQNVYAAGIGDDAIAAFDRDASKGSTAATRGEHLLYIDRYVNGESGITGIADVNSLAISSDGGFVFAGSRDESTLAVFERKADGSLDFVVSYSHANGTTDGLLGISDIAVDSSTQSLYVAGQFGASVAHYTISGTGHLTLVGAVANGDLGVSGLAGARTLVLSPDEDHVIVGSGIDDSVVVLSRSQVTGEIVFQQNLVGVGDQPMDVAVSPDGEHVYVASANDSRLIVINRNNNPVSAEYGQLSIITSYIDDVGGFDRLQGLRAVAVSPNGEKVYVGAEFDAAVSVLDRDKNPNSATFGQLAVVEVQIDDVDGVNGLNQLYDLAVSSDSRHVYAAGFGDNALAAFMLGVGSACSAQGSGNILDTVDIGSNGTLTYSVTGLIRPNAVGQLVTEARILPPQNFSVINPSDNCANPTASADDNCDQDTTDLVPVTDLSITKSNGKLSLIAGEPVSYEIRVSNAGPSDANSTAVERVMVKDILGAGFEPGSVSWTCEAVGSGSLSFVDALIDDGSTVQGLVGVSSLAYSENLAGLGPHVLAVSVTDNALTAFAVNVLNGELSQVGSPVTAGAGVSLQGARDILIIDNDIYVASQVDDALVAFKAQDSGGLSLQLELNHEFPAVPFGLNQAVSVTASSNGLHVYVTGANDDAVVIFTRNPGTGELTLAGTVSGPGQGLSGVNTMAVSDDGESVYTSGFNDNEVGVYRRDLVSGALTFVEVLNVSGVTFDEVSAIQISPDDEHVYVTSAANHQVHVLVRDTSVPTSSSDYGQLSWVQTVEQGVGGVSGLLTPSDVLISADGRHVYVSSEQSDAVVWFARNDATGELVYGGLISDLVSSVDGLNGAIALATDASGQYIYVAGSQDHGIAVLTRSADSFCPAAGVGNVSEMVGPVEAGVQVDLAVNGELIFTVDATVAADATDTLVNEVRVLSCDLPLSDPVESCSGSDPDTSNNLASDSDALNPTADLMISKTDDISLYEGLTGATQLAGDDQYVYVAASQDNAISMFRRETNSAESDFGYLSYLGQMKNGEDGVSGLLAATDVIISADGQTVYAAGAGDNSVVVFSKGSDGVLSYVEKHSSGVFGVVGIEGVSALSLSPDGAHLYATGPLTNSLAVFEVDQSGGADHGKLNFIQQLQNAVDGVNGLANVSDVLVSNDNKHVYVTSESGHSVSLFLRNPNDASVSYGQLSYLNTYANGADGIAGMLGARALLLDDAGAFLYALGAVDQALAVFSRDDGTGELTFVEFKQNGTSGVVGLNLARDLVLSADQQSLYVAGRGENALVHFDRNLGDGTLSFNSVINDGDPLAQPGTFVDGLSGSAGLFMSSDDEHVYVVADQDHSVALFSRDTSTNVGELSTENVLINGRGGVAPGAELTYLIIASNAGPSDVEKARIVDLFPPEFESVSYQCFPVNGAGCNTSVQVGNVDELVDLPVGSHVEIRATGVIRPDASGVISNTATIASSTNPAFAVSDPDLSNNTATDDDTVLFVASDLVVTKDNGLTELVPGTQVTYNITVSNDAVLPGNSVPADVSGVMVTDVVPEAISDVSWTCDAFPQPGLLDDGDGNPGTTAFVSFTELDLFNDMVISTTGEFAYVVGEDAGDSILLVYQRNSRSGDLVEIQRVAASDAAINGLAGAEAMALSGDGRHLYVVADVDDSITTWSINPATGLVSFDDVMTDGLLGVNGLGGANDVLVTTDGMHVYAAGKSDNAIAVFDRNIGTGELTFNSSFSGVEGLSGVHVLIESGDYLVVASEANQSIATFTRSAQNGLLVSADVIQDFELPGSVLESPRNVAVLPGFVLVASADSDAVALFEMNTVDGSLNFVQVVRQGDTNVTHLEGPEGLLVSASGQEVYVASMISEAITLFQFEDGLLVPGGVVYDNTLIPELDGANQLVANNQGTHLYGLSDELVLAEVQNGSACTRVGNGSLNDVADIVSGGRVEYTLTGTVIPTASGSISNTATALMGGEQVELNPQDNTATDIDVLVPTSDLSITKDDGLLEVVAGTELVYDLSVFSAGPSAINATVEDLMPIFPTQTAGFESAQVDWLCSTGRTLQLNGAYLSEDFDGLVTGTDVVESPESDFVYVASAAGYLTVFAKDTSGVLTQVQLINDGDDLPGGQLNGLVGATALAMDTGGANLYLVNQATNQLITLTRDAVTGELDYLSTITSGADVVFGMLGPVDLAVAPDGAGVYVAAYESDAITVFSRDPSDGDLTFVERVKDGFGTIVPESNVIIEITGVIISPDGQQLYAAAEFSEAVSVFSRDPNTQILTFESVIRAGDMHGAQAVPAMSGPQKLVSTNNGDFVYSVVQGSSALWRFKRNQSDGQLTFEAELSDGDAGAGSMISPNRLTLTPNGGRLLVTDTSNNSMTVYDRDTVTGELILVDEIDLNVSESDALVNPLAMTSDGVNVYLVLNQIDTLLVVRITADAECQLESEVTDTPLIPIYMSPGSAAQIQVSGLVHPAARGTITNIANVLLSLDSRDDNLVNNTAMDDTVIVVQTDVNLEKIGPQDAIAGEMMEYQLVLTNTGSSDALGVMLEDILPVQLLNPTWTCAPTGRSQCSNPSGSGNINESVDVGVDGEVRFVVTALINPAYVGDITNEAEAVVFEAGFNTDTDLSNNTASVTTQITRVADLSVVKSNVGNEVVAGEPTDYLIVVSNPGPSDATAHFIDVMPSELDMVTWQCTAGSGSSCTAAGQGNIDDMIYVAANSDVTYAVDAMVLSSAAGQVINEAMADPVAPLNDPELSNNLSVDTDKITQVADVSVTLQDLIDPYDPASPLDLPFNLQVINHGPSDATNVQVNLPLQIDVTADTVNVCAVSDSGVNCDIGYAAAGQTNEFIVNYRLNPALTGQVDNLAEATSDTFDPDLANNTSTTVTDLLTGVDVRVTQSNGHDMVEPGQNLTYEIIVENIGSVDAGEVTIDEQLPSSLINASWQCVAFDGAACVNLDESGLTGGADLPSGGRVVMTLTATVDPALVDMSQTHISNTVEAILISEADFNLLNNISTDTDPLVYFIFRNGFEGGAP